MDATTATKLIRSSTMICPISVPAIPIAVVNARTISPGLNRSCRPPWMAIVIGIRALPNTARTPEVCYSLGIIDGAATVLGPRRARCSKITIG
jgi:hypothetical protein